MMTYDFILQGSEATEDNAIAAARGLDWSECELSEFTPKYKDYIGTYNGIDIFYDYGADYYFFSETTILDD